MLNHPTVLIIGNDQAIHSSQCQPLEQRYRIVHALDADQVIDITTDDSVDIVIVDSVSLGQGSALDICIWLKTDNDTRQLPVVVLGPDTQNVQTWLNAGVLDYVFSSMPAALLDLKVSTLLELQHKSGLLSSIAGLDPLTAVADQQRLNEYLDIEWRRSLREYYPISLIKFDIDVFAAYNDGYGINAGDDALKQIARTLESHSQRAGDMVSRYGPDEFIVLLPSTELESALAVAERMINAVSELSIEHSSSHLADILTMTAGVVTIEPSRDKRLQDLFDEVEEVLVRAQQEGGNQAMGVAI